MTDWSSGDSIATSSDHPSRERALRDVESAAAMFDLRKTPGADQWRNPPSPEFRRATRRVADRVRRSRGRAGSGPVGAGAIVMASRALVRPGESTHVGARVALILARSVEVSRIVIAERPELWLVQDVTIDGESQLMGGAPIPGQAFARDAPSGIRIAPLRDGARIEVVAAFTGPEPGAVFSCAVFTRPVKA